MGIYTSAHDPAVSIEFMLRREFDCNRGGFGGIANADFVEYHWYTAIAAGLGFRYATANEAKRSEIKLFIHRFGYYLEIDLNKLLAFSSNTSIVNGSQVTIDYENGSVAISAVIEALRAVLD